MYAIWVWKDMAVISDDMFSLIRHRLHPRSYCYDWMNTMEDAIRECKMHSWKVVYSHFPEQEDDDV